MIWFAVLVVLVIVMAVRLTRLVTSDGYGQTPTPRSQTAEIGSWVDVELRR